MYDDGNVDEVSRLRRELRDAQKRITELEDLSIVGAKRQLQATLDVGGDGVDCPVCGQFCKRYRRPINSTQAKCLTQLVVNWDKTHDWVRSNDCRPPDMPDAVHPTGEIGKLVHWGLVEAKPNEDDSTKKCSGFWRPTESGISYVKGHMEVPSAAYIFNNTCVGFDCDRWVTIDDARGERFDYAELMRS